MSKNRNLNRAKVAKNDEFYTRLSDIEKEMVHYKKHFKGKTIYCPCDDPYASNFFKYFAMNFEHLGLKRLITACYKNTDPLRRSNHDMDGAIWLEYTGDKNGNRVPDPSEIGVHRFEGDGDFRSEESRELMRQSDIVVTNPPFSLFGEFMDVLMAENVGFIAIGNINSMTHKSVLPSILRGGCWIGADSVHRNKWFEVPLGSPMRKNRSEVTIDDDGVRHQWASFGNVCWYTNIEHDKRNQMLPIYKKFEAISYPKYDNYDAIEVSDCRWIPDDYNGVMGVPITFMDKHNPDQFDLTGYAPAPMLAGRAKYKRILIRHAR